MFSSMDNENKKEIEVDQKYEARQQHFFELMYSSLPIEKLMNPTYEVLETLIKGRRNMTNCFDFAIKKQIASWSMCSCCVGYIVEGVKKNFIDKTDPHHPYSLDEPGQYIFINEIKPEEIYRIYPTAFFFFDEKKENEVRTLQKKGIINPLFENPLEFYLPIFITKKKSETENMKININVLENLDISNIIQVINSTLQTQTYPLGRSIDEVEKIVSKNKSWIKKNNDYLLTKITINSKHVNLIEPHCSLKLKTILTEENIASVEPAHLSNTFKKPISIIKNNLNLFYAELSFHKENLDLPYDEESIKITITSPDYFK